MRNSGEPPRDLEAFKLRRRIAIGSVSEVFLATEPRSVGAPRDVVVKRMLPELAADPIARTIFAEEARFGRRITHPNVVKVLGHGTSGPLPFVVVERVIGCDLGRFLRYLQESRMAISVELGLYVAREIALGVAAVHDAVDERGLRLEAVHQDIHPSSVLISRFGDVKLADLGMARQRLRAHFVGTSAGERMKGPPAYLSPEQVEGKPVDARTDVFCLGTVAAELLLGRPLFEAPSELSTLLAIRDVDLTRLHVAAPGLPQRAVGALLQALVRDPAQRTPSAKALAGELGRALPQDTAPFARELGDLVAIVLDDDATEGSAEASRTTLQGVAAIADDGSRTTLEFIPSVYEVARPSGTESLTYAAIVERVATGTLPPTAEVSIDGSARRRISHIDELARHVPPSARRSAPPLAGPGMKIPFQGGGFFEAFVRAVATEATGAFLCERGTERKEVALSGGVPTFVGGNVAAEMLGEFLVARGVVNRGELDMALALLPRYEGRLGDTLVGLGLVDGVQLFREIGVQVRERLLDLFTWRNGTAEFVTDLGPIDGSFPPDADIFSVLDEGIRRRLLAGMERRPLDAEPQLRVVRADAVPPGFEQSRLPRAEKLLVLRTRTPTAARTLLDDLERDLDGDRDRAERAMLLLLSARVLNRA